MDEKLSIIIPIFNMEQYLERCLDSIFCQDLTNVKVICINDGSTDGTNKILSNYKNIYSDKIEVVNIPNSGRATARNVGIDQVNEGFIWFVDPDDYISKNSISILKKSLKENPDVVVFNWVNVFKDHTESSNFGTSIVEAGSGSANKIFKRKLISAYRYPKNYWYEDLGFIPILIGVAKKIIKVDDSLYFYDRTRESSQTNTFDVERITDTIPMCERVYTELIGVLGMEELKTQVELLFYQHLVINSILLKFVHIRKKSDRDIIVDKVTQAMNKRFNHWQSAIKSIGNTNCIKYNLKRFIVFCYLKKIYVLGDCIWLKFAKTKY